MYYGSWNATAVLFSFFFFFFFCSVFDVIFCFLVPDIPMASNHSAELGSTASNFPVEVS